MEMRTSDCGFMGAYGGIKTVPCVETKIFMQMNIIHKLTIQEVKMGKIMEM